MNFGTFQRGGQTRRAATPAQAVKLKHDGFRQVEAAALADDHVGLGPELEPMTVAELRDYATEHAIELGDAHRKAELLAVIAAANEVSADSTDEEENES
jgi:hypothetical protein